MLLRGFDDKFYVPHSRHTTVLESDIRANKELKILSTSKEAGVYAISSKNSRQFFITGHSEYDATTLRDEYLRDLGEGKEIEIPKNYFPDDDPKREPIVTWRGHSNLIYSNWLNYFVYQTTPFDLENLGK